MKPPLVRLLIPALVLGALVARAVSAPRATDDPAEPAATGDAAPIDVAQASQRFLNFVLLPVWMVPGFGDYLCHRASKIERTSGTHESLTHMLMISSSGAGIAAGLFFEVNELVLAIMLTAAAVHEAVVWWDVAYACSVRPPSATEQHLHSFLEVLPFTGLAFTLCLHPDALAALAGRGKRPRRFRFERKRNPGSPLYAAGIVTLATFALFVPYAEELVRCFRVDHTILPHRTPIEGTAPGQAK